MVSRGFQRSPLEIVAMLVALAAFVLLLVVAARIQRRRAHRLRRTIAQGRYAELARRADLQGAEHELLQRLAAHLRDPDKKYLLLVNQTTFNFCASRLRAEDPSVETRLTELRLKLGFRMRGQEQVPVSSAELPDGQAVLLVDAAARPARRLQATVTGQRPEALMVRLAPGSVVPPQAMPLRLYFQNRSGLFNFPTRVLLSDERTGALHLAHSEQIQRIQRRRYYRRRVSLPVSVRAAGTAAEPTASLFLDIGGEGASLRNPRGRFTPGEDVQLDFRAGGESFSLVAEILRLSRGGRLMHVRFAPMREASRDQLIGAVSAFPAGPEAGNVPADSEAGSQAADKPRPPPDRSP